MMSGHVRFRGVGLLVGTALLATACGAGTAQGTGGDTPAVVAAVYPLQWLSEQVGGPGVKVSALTSPGVEPHDAELGPQQMADLQASALTVYIKGLQPAVDDAVAGEAKGFDAASAVQVLEAEHHVDDGHGHEAATDPHLWLDPSRLALVATRLGDRLAAAVPEQAQGFKDRAAATSATLTALDKEMAQGLRQCTGRSLVTSHEAFGYLADRYDLKQVGITLDPESEPSPARIAEVAKIARAEKVSTVFTESLASPKVAEVLASEVGAKTAALDPLESKPASGDYLSAMRANLATLRTALGCT
jgi:zinc transport system substrate-binding protein